MRDTRQMNFHGEIETLKYALDCAYAHEDILSDDTMALILRQCGVTARQFIFCKQTVKKKAPFKPEDVLLMLFIVNEGFFATCRIPQRLSGLKLRCSIDGKYDDLAIETRNQAAELCGMCKCERCWRYVKSAADCHCTRVQDQSLRSRLLHHRQKGAAVGRRQTRNNRPTKRSVCPRRRGLKCASEPDRRCFQRELRCW
jgi:hypothetical protein